MSNILWKSLLFSPVVLGFALVSVAGANSARSPDQESPSVIDQVVRYTKEGSGTTDDAIGKVTFVSQLGDVQPTDWAFLALQSLVERYGVIAGYPDGTFRGNRALTRYEFAAGLNAALDRVNELISTGSSKLIRNEDITTLQRLQQEFSVELATIRSRVDSLEAHTAQLEANQFSTTTKLVGTATFAVTDNLGNYRNDHTVFQDEIQLDFQTSFTGKDTLHTRLAAGNGARLNFHNAVAFGGPTGPFATYEGEGTQTFNFVPNTSNGFGLTWLSYYFPVFGNGQVYLAAVGGYTSDIAPPNNPYFYDADNGTAALSIFGEQNSIFRIGGGAGAGLTLPLGGGGGILGASSLSLIYLADNASSPARKSGLFNGDYVALGELNFNLSKRFDIAATYAHGYHTTGSGIFNSGGPGSSTSPFQGIVGTAQANDPSLLLAGGQVPTVTNSYGLEVAYRLSDKISISGWVDKTNVRLLGRGNGEIWSYAIGFAFPDLGKKGNVLGLIGGLEPTLRGLRAVGAPAHFARDYGYHIELFYKYQLTDNISITPGIIYLTAPGQNAANNDAVIGTLRTTFTF